MKVWDSVKSFARECASKLVVVCMAVAVVTVFICKAVYAQSLDLTGVSVDTAPVFTMTTIVITGLAAIWVVWKTINIIRAR